MMSLKWRTIMILIVIAASLFATWAIAGLSEALLKESNIQHVALAAFAGAALIDIVGLGWFISMAILELGRHDERNKDMVAIGESERLLIRTTTAGTYPLQELGQNAAQPVAVIVPSRRKRPMPLDAAHLDSKLYSRLVKEGGNSHGH